jgi:hypothetical protein
VGVIFACGNVDQGAFKPKAIAEKVDFFVTGQGPQYHHGHSFGPLTHGRLEGLTLPLSIPDAKPSVDSRRRLGTTD